MKESQKEFKEAIVVVGESLELKVATELLLSNIGINSTIKELIYKMFVDNKNDYFEKNNKVYDAVQLIRSYAIEMRDNGKVVFDVPYEYKPLSKYKPSEDGE